MPSLTVENYVKTIFSICGQGENECRAATGQLAASLGVSPGTVTSMLKTLSEGGLATYTPYEGVRLTDHGCDLALKILRRHRLIELFLTKALDMEWDEVHEDADRLEHAVSDALIDRIDAYLNYPRFDPHGDPIPTAHGLRDDRDISSLADCPCGSQFCLARVADQSSEFLRYLRQTGLPLGVEGEVVVNQPEAGIITLRIHGQERTLGRPAAEKLLVTVRQPQPVMAAASVGEV